MGHRGTGLDNAWVHDNLQVKMNAGYRSTHVATLAANAIVRAFYGREVSRSYFSGCSTGLLAQEAPEESPESRGVEDGAHHAYELTAAQTDRTETSHGLSGRLHAAKWGP